MHRNALRRLLHARRLTVSLVAAALSHRWFERPMRNRSLRFGPVTPGRLAPLVVVGIVAATLGVGTVSAASSGFDAEAASAKLHKLSRGTTPPGSAPRRPTATLSDARSGNPPTFAIFGDSVER